MSWLPLTCSLSYLCLSAGEANKGSEVAKSYRFEWEVDKGAQWDFLSLFAPDYNTLRLVWNESTPPTYSDLPSLPRLASSGVLASTARVQAVSFAGLLKAQANGGTFSPAPSLKYAYLKAAPPPPTSGQIKRYSAAVSFDCSESLPAWWLLKSKITFSIRTRRGEAHSAPPILILHCRILMNPPWGGLSKSAERLVTPSGPSNGENLVY